MKFFFNGGSREPCWKLGGGLMNVEKGDNKQSLPQSVWVFVAVVQHVYMMVFQGGPQ